MFHFIKKTGEKDVKKKICAALLALLTLLIPARAEHTRDGIRLAYRNISDWSADSPYEEQPRVSAPYAPGALTEAALEDALDYLNFIRWLADLEPVKGSEIYNYQCQHGAVLLAALDYVDHNAPNPGDMDKNFYDSAHLATASGNIARFNWMRNSMIREGIAYFVRDDGDQNLPLLGHRRWALNPMMGATGFGLANAQSGMSYVVMYAHDLGNRDAVWDCVRWPAAGAFPAELMHDHLAWSVMLNPELYDLSASNVEVTLREESLGLSFVFHPGEGTGDGFCAVNLEPYGAGGCVIFRPDFSGTGFIDYQQNQHWKVHIGGLAARQGGETGMNYAVDMIALRAEDAVNVEISTLEASLHVGEALALSAQVIPAYADDISVTWASSDEAVATVDGNGGVLAIAPGRCEIICADCAGHTDACALTVEN